MTWEEGGRRRRRRREGRRGRRRRSFPVCDQMKTNHSGVLTVEGSIPHPLGDDYSWRPFGRHRQGLVQSLSVEHQAVVKASSYNVHLHMRNRTHHFFNQDSVWINNSSLLLFPSHVSNFPCKYSFWITADELYGDISSHKLSTFLISLTVNLTLQPALSDGLKSKWLADKHSI